MNVVSVLILLILVWFVWSIATKGGIPIIDASPKETYVQRSGQRF